MEGMTLDELLRAYGMNQPSDLADVVDIDRRYAWQIWHGKRRITTKLALLLFERKGIPLEHLLRAQARKAPVPRGPRRKRPRREGPEQ
jgi:transcriptional regulator with XRE-family HTH domain